MSPSKGRSEARHNGNKVLTSVSSAKIFHTRASSSLGNFRP